MKNKLLFCIFLLVFFFYSPRVFAKSYNVQPNSVLARYNDEVVFQGSTYGWHLQGNTAFHSFDTDKIVNRIYYTYTNGVADLDYRNTNYDVSFKLFLPNVSVASLNGFNAGKPIVFINNNTCFVDYASSETMSSSTFSHVFGVKCTNVSFDSSTFNIDVLTAPHSAPQSSLSGNRFGISFGMDFSAILNNNDLSSSIKENTEETKKQTEAIKDSNTNDAISSSNGFFKDFTSDDFGLSDIVTMPLSFINGMSSSQCYSLNLPLPFVKQNAELPCMTSIYKQHFGSFLTIYQTITTGFIAYWVCINIFRLVQNFKNPDNDEVEVLDL